MGLCGAPGTFQNAMDQAFHAPATINGISTPFIEFLQIYLDDRCIHSGTIEEHILHLRAVFERLRIQKYYVKPSKCEFARACIEFLGHTVGPTGMSITTSRVDVLQQWPEPSNLHELRRLLGTFGFWRSYIKNYAYIVYPLTLLTRKGVVWRWGEPERASLVALKRAVKESPVLLAPDCNKPFILVTDASDYAIGASLEQCDEEDKRRPVTYFSHQLNQAEQNYPVHERELLAIVIALRTWRHLLLGSNFTVECQTDHRPLQSFLMQTTLSSRQVRWQQFLSEFNLRVSYIPGKANEFADGLSRIHLRLVAALAPFDSWLSRINEATLVDADAVKLRKNAINIDENTKNEVGSTAYVLLHGVLYYRHAGTYKVYVPKSIRSALLAEYHNIPIAGHLGWKKTYHAMNQHYYWPNMPSDVRSYTSSCPICQRVKPTKQQPPPLQPLEVPLRPFQEITLDWLSGFPKDKQGHDGVLNIVDRFSKWSIMIPTDKHMTTAGMCDVLYKHVFSWVGLPASIIGDRDSRLTASWMRKLVKYLVLRLKLSTAYHPQTDGETERFHATFLQMLRSFVTKNHRDWSEHIPALLYAYHNTIHTATGYTPHMLLFGWCPRDLRAPLSATESTGDSDLDYWLGTRRKSLQKAQVSLQSTRDAMIRAHKASSKPYTYAAGNQVKISTRVLPLHRTDTQCAKLMPKYVGPFEVVSVLGKVVQVKLPASYSKVHDKFNVIDVRPWFHSDERTVEVDYPAVTAHPALNPVVQVLDRKRVAGRQPQAPVSLLDIPAQYLIVRRDGSTAWIRGTALSEPDEIKLIKKFEMRYKRTEDLPCDPIAAYSATGQMLDHEYVSEDELDLHWAEEIANHFE